MSGLAKEAIVDAFNEQIGHEMGASLQYVSIASYFAGETLPELAKFFYRQADEERDHAMKFVRFIVDVDGTVRIPAIPAPKAEFASAREAVALSLAWEKTVTEQIYQLVDVARGDKNYIAMRFLDWFVTEQLEEVSSMTSLLAVIERAGDHGLLHVEDYLARQGVGPAGPAASAT
jgi:ferritin